MGLAIPHTASDSGYSNYLGIHLGGHEWVTQYMTAVKVDPLRLPVPESPRWQLRHGQEDRALRTLAQLHANGDESDELVQYELAEMRESLAKDDGLASVSYLEFFKTRGNRRRLLVTCVVAAGAQLGGNTLVSYYLAPILRLIGITDPPQQAGINAGLVSFCPNVTTCSLAAC